MSVESLFEEEKKIDTCTVKFISEETEELFSCDLSQLVKMSHFYKEYFEIYSPAVVHAVPVHISHIFGQIMMIVNRTSDGIEHQSLHTTVEILKAANFLMMDILVGMCVDHIVFNLSDNPQTLVWLSNSKDIDKHIIEQIVRLRNKVTAYKKLEHLVALKTDIHPTITQHIAYLVYMTFTWNHDNTIEWPSATKNWGKLASQTRQFGTTLLGKHVVSNWIKEYIVPLLEDDIEISENVSNCVVIGAVLDVLCRHGFVNEVRRFIITEFETGDIIYLQNMYNTV